MATPNKHKLDDCELLQNDSKHIHQLNEDLNIIGIEMLPENLAFSGEEARKIILERVNKILDYYENK